MFKIHLLVVGRPTVGPYGFEPFHAGREKIQTIQSGKYQNRHGPIAGKFGGSFAQTNFNTNDPNVQNPIQTGHIPAK